MMLKSGGFKGEFKPLFLLLCVFFFLLFFKTIF